MRYSVGHCASSLQRSLQFHCSDPFRNLLESYFIDANRKPNEALSGCAEAVAGSRHDAGIVEQFGGELRRGQPFRSRYPNIERRTGLLAFEPNGPQTIDQNVPSFLINLS